VIDTMFRTPEREATLRFSAPYAEVPVHIYVHKDIGGIRDLASLQGFVVGVKDGDACVSQLAAAGVTRLTRLASYQALIEAAKANTVRMFCMDGPPADFLLYRAGMHRDYRAVLTLGGGQLHRAVHKADLATLTLVEKGFAAFTDDDLEALSRQWLGPEERAPAAWEHYVGLIALGGCCWGGLPGLGHGPAPHGGAAHRRAARPASPAADPDQHPARPGLRQGPLRPLHDLQPGLCRAAWPRGRGHRRQDRQRVAARGRGPAGPAARPRSPAAWAPHHRRGMAALPGQAEAGLFEVIRTPLRDTQQRVIGVVGIARDVTQYRQNEERLSRLNRLYRVLARVQEASALTRDAVTLYGVVCGALKSEGSLYEAWIGQPDAAEDWLQPVAQVGFIDAPAPVPLREDPPTSVEARAWHGGGMVVDHLLEEVDAPGDTRVAVVLRAGSQRRAVLSLCGDRLGPEETALLERLAGQVSLALAAAEAETTRRVAVAALQDSEMRFAQMFQTSPVGMLLCRANDSHVVDVNTAWLELFGQRIDEVIGRPVEALRLSPAGRRTAICSKPCCARAPGQEPRDRLQRRNGEALDIAFSATRMSIGAQDYLLASFVDITYQKLATRQLAAEAELLEREVARRTAQLNSLFEALPDMYFRLGRWADPGCPGREQRRPGAPGAGADRAAHRGGAFRRGHAAAAAGHRAGLADAPAGHGRVRGHPGPHGPADLRSPPGAGRRGRGGGGPQCLRTPRPGGRARSGARAGRAPGPPPQRVPGQHEPRDPHPAQRHPGLCPAGLDRRARPRPRKAICASSAPGGCCWASSTTCSTSRRSRPSGWTWSPSRPTRAS
jgi:PAS domain S-box-containing protein